MNEVNNALQSLGLFKLYEGVKDALNLSITVDDLGEEFSKMEDFLKSNGLEDENLFFNIFNIHPYGLVIHVTTISSSNYEDY